MLHLTQGTVRPQNLEEGQAKRDVSLFEVVLGRRQCCEWGRSDGDWDRTVEGNYFCGRIVDVLAICDG